MAIGQTSGAGTNYLYRSTLMPAYDTGTICGYYYHAATPGANGAGIVSYYDSSAQKSTLYVSNTDVLNFYNGGTAGSLYTLSVGVWYFWALTLNGNTATIYFTPLNTAISASVGSITKATSRTTTDIWLLQDNGGTGAGVGYVANVRAWSSVLAIPDLNLERIRNIAQYPGPLFDAPLATTAALNGFSISGALSNIFNPEIYTPLVPEVEAIYRSATINGTSFPVTISTGGPNRVLVAFASDTIANAPSITGVSGGGLTWSMQDDATSKSTVANGWGTQVWTALAPTQLTAQTITLAMSGFSDGGFVVLVIKGADPSKTIGAHGAMGDSADGAVPRVTLTPRYHGSLILAGFNFTTGDGTTPRADSALLEFSSVGDLYASYAGTRPCPAGVAYSVGAVNSAAGSVWTGCAIEIKSKSSMVSLVDWVQGQNVSAAPSVTSPSFTPVAGDLLVLACNVGQGADFTSPTSSTGAVFTPRVQDLIHNGTTQIFTAIANSGAAQTVTVSHLANGYQWGMAVYVLRNWSSIGVDASNWNGSTQYPTVTLAGTTVGSFITGAGWDYSSWTGGFLEYLESYNMMGPGVAMNDAAGDTLWWTRIKNPIGGTISLNGNLNVAAQDWGYNVLEILPAPDLSPTLMVGPLTAGLDDVSIQTLDSPNVNYTIGSNPLLVVAISGADYGNAIGAFPLASVVWQSGTTSGTWTKVSASSTFMTAPWSGAMGVEFWVCVPTANIVNGVVRITKGNAADNIGLKLGVYGYDNATTGASATLLDQSATLVTLATNITPQASGSQIVAAWVDYNSVAAQTANANTVEDAHCTNTLAGAYAAVGRGINPTVGGTPISIGVTDSRNYVAMGLLEIKAPSGIIGFRVFGFRM